MKTKCAFLVSVLTGPITNNNFLVINLVLIILFSIFWIDFFGERLSTPTDVAQAGELYANSQYVLGDASPHKIADYVVYTYAGAQYFKGESPTQINFEHPPLGKYILGLSIVLFKNVAWLNVGLYVLSYLLIASLTLRVTQSRVLSLLSIIGYGLLKLVPEYATQGMLDMPLLFFTLSFFWLLLSRQFNLAVIVWLGITWGAIASIKYPVPSVGLLVVILLIVAIQRKSKKLLVGTLLVGGLVYLATYLRFFLMGNTIADWLAFEWYRFKWWTGDRSMPKFLLLLTLFTGRFKGFWAENEYEVATSWSWLWPGLFLSSVGTVVINWRKIWLHPLVIFSFGQFSLYLIGGASSERYLIQVLPFWIILSMMGLINLCPNNDTNLLQRCT